MYIFCVSSEEGVLRLIYGLQQFPNAHQIVIKSWVFVFLRTSGVRCVDLGLAGSINALID